MKNRFAIAAFVMALLVPSLAIHAQAPTATLVGRVTDPTRAIIVGATINIRNIDTNELRFAKTDSHGEYTVSSLDPGNYDVLIESPTFKSVHKPKLVLQADQTARLDAAMVMGASTEEVTVTSEVGALHTETSDKGDVIAPVEIAEMPLNGRDFNDLVLNIAGVMPSEQGSKGSEFVANGVRADAANIMVDGLNNTNPRDAGAEATPPLDALQEFKVQTSNYSAEYGRVAGPVINLVIKKGSNSLKGSVFEFVRNDLFDARKHFDDPGFKSELRRNQFGATLGGPVFLPHLYNGHDKTFFLFSWESYRDVDANPSISTVPTPAERAGDFSASFNSNTGKTLATNQLKDYFGNTACVPPNAGPTGKGNFIPASCFDPIAASLINFYPQQSPNRIGNLAGNFNQNVKNRETWDNYLLKLDQQIGHKDEASIKGGRKNDRSLNGTSGSTLGSFGAITTTQDTIAAFQETHIFKPTMINEFRFGLTRKVDNELALDAGTDWAALLGIPGTTSDLSLAQFPQFKVTSYATIGDSTTNPIVYTTNNYDMNDSVTITEGKHTVKIGGDALRVQYFQPTNSGFSGTLTFDGKTSGNGFADLLRGGPSAVGLRAGTVVNHLFDAANSVFVQDDYKTFSRLTMNLGLRYEYQTLPHEENGQFSNFVPALDKLILAANATPAIKAQLAADNVTANVGFASDYGYPQTLIYPNDLRFAPRVGFALRPFNDNGTVVRGGYGIFYTGSRLSAIRTDLSGQYPFSIQNSFAIKGVTTIEQAFQTAGPVKGVTTASGYDLHAPSAYVQSWNFTVERELPKGVAVEVAYTGSKGTHLGRKYDINQTVRTPTSSIRPYAFFGNVSYYVFNSYSAYHAGTITVRKRFEHGLMFRMNYTYGKSLDTQSGLNYEGDGGYTGAQDSLHPESEYGRSDSDRRHVLNGNWVYQLPFRNRIVSRGWQLAGSLQGATGTPFTPQYTVPTQDKGQATRPDRICNGALPTSQRTQDHWFDPSCFVQVPDSAFRFGNSGRNILDGPGRFTVAASLSRSFQVREYGKLQFRFEVFNATNHTNLQIPEDTLDVQAVNTINKADDQRILQLGSKFVF